MEIVGYLAAILMGLTLGLIGGGGSILTVPILVYLFQVEANVAATYSLFIVGSTAFIGGLKYLKKNEVELKAGFIFALPSLLAVFLTKAILVPLLPEPLFVVSSISLSQSDFVMTLFSLLMLSASRSLIKSSPPPKDDSMTSSVSKVARIGGKGFFVGVISGLIGAGGGFLIIPALVLLVGIPMKKAIGTSLFIIAANSLIGILSSLNQPIHFRWNLIFSLTAIALVGLWIGANSSQKFSEKSLKRGFGYFVFIMGIMILIDQIRQFI